MFVCRRYLSGLQSLLHAQQWFADIAVDDPVGRQQPADDPQQPRHQPNVRRYRSCVHQTGRRAEICSDHGQNTAGRWEFFVLFEKSTDNSTHALNCRCNIYLYCNASAYSPATGAMFCYITCTNLTHVMFSALVRVPLVTCHRWYVLLRSCTHLRQVHRILRSSRLLLCKQLSWSWFCCYLCLPDARDALFCYCVPAITLVPLTPNIWFIS